jgi:hypothetical protein
VEDGSTANPPDAKTPLSASITNDHTPTTTTVTTATSKVRDSAAQPAHNPRSQKKKTVPPPLRIEHSNFDKTPSVRSKAGSTRNSHSQKSNLRRNTLSVSGPDPDDFGSNDPINNSCSNITASTYCHNTSTTTIDHYPQPQQPPAAMHKSASPYYSADKKYSEVHRHEDMDDEIVDEYQAHRNGSRYGGIIVKPELDRTNTPSVMSVTESDFSRKGSFSTLSRDLEIIDLLERERSMDIQEMMERERKLDAYMPRHTPKYEEYYDHTPTSANISRSMAARRSSGQSHHSSHTPSMSGFPMNDQLPYNVGQRKSIELEKRFSRTYSNNSRSSTKSRDRRSLRGSDLPIYDEK